MRMFYTTPYPTIDRSAACFPFSPPFVFLSFFSCRARSYPSIYPCTFIFSPLLFSLLSLSPSPFLPLSYLLVFRVTSCHVDGRKTEYWVPPRASPLLCPALFRCCCNAAALPRSPGRLPSYPGGWEAAERCEIGFASLICLTFSPPYRIASSEDQIITFFGYRIDHETFF